MEYILSDVTVDKFVEYGVNVFDLRSEGKDRYDVAREAIAATRQVFVLSLIHI